MNNTQQAGERFFDAGASAREELLPNVEQVGIITSASETCREDYAAINL